MTSATAQQRWWQGWLLGFLLLAVRLRLLSVFGFRYTDDDQAVLWYAARDFADGHLREPCFFGQAYGTAVEGYLASPLLRMGAPFWIAVPLVSAAFAVAPYFVLAAFARRRGAELAALAILIVPMILPVSYAQISGMPRGLVPGPFLAIVGAPLLMSPRPWIAGVGALAAVLGFSFNESTLVLAAPILLYAGLTRREPSFRRAAAIGVAGGLSLHLLSRAFYWLNPAYRTHPSWTMQLSGHALMQNLRDADRILSPYVPFGLPAWVLAAGALALLISILRAGDKPAALSCLAWILATLAMFCSSKVADGMESIFFNQARFFLTIPFGFAFFMALAIRPGPLRRPAGIVLVLVGAAAAAGQAISIHGLEGTDLDDGGTRIVGVGAYPVDDIVDLCQGAIQVARETRTEMIVYARGRALAYACGALGYGSVETLFAPYERRTWVLQKEASTARTSLLLYPASEYPCDAFRGVARTCSIVDPVKDLERITFEPVPVVDVLRRAGVSVRAIGGS